MYPLYFFSAPGKYSACDCLHVYHSTKLEAPKRQTDSKPGSFIFEIPAPSHGLANSRYIISVKGPGECRTQPATISHEPELL